MPGLWAYPAGSSRCGFAQRVEAAIEVFDQVLWVFEANMEAQGRTFGLPARRATDARGRGRLDQALEPAPTGADAEQVERVDQRVDRLFGRWLQHHAKQSAGAEEIAFPQGMARIFGQGRVKHPRHFGPGLQPARHYERILLVPF